MAAVERIISPKVADDGSVHYSSVTSAPDDSTAVCYMVPNRIIPVIFVPGIMGTNLEDEGGNPVWLVDSGGTVAGWGTKKPAQRKTILNPAKTLFHSDISGKYHANTYAFYGNDKDHKAYGDVTWVQQAPSMLRGSIPPIASLLRVRGTDDPGTGGQRIKTDHGGKTALAQFVLNDADENGDGTVPVRSGLAPSRHARACVAFAGIELEGAYKLDATRRFTLGAITRIAQSVKGTPLEYKA